MGYFRERKALCNKKGCVCVVCVCVCVGGGGGGGGGLILEGGPIFERLGYM